MRIEKGAPGQLQGQHNILIMEVPEAEEVEQEIENLFEKIMTANFPNLMKEIDIQVQEAQGVTNKINQKRPTPSHIIIKMPKVKDKESSKPQEKSSQLPIREPL